MHNVYLFQPQYAVDVRNETNYWLPYSVGCIWSYVAQFPHITDNFQLRELFFKRQDPVEILDTLENPIVCAFSCYVWNIKYCLLIAEKIKATWPDCHIVFGGPQINSKYLNHRFVDSVVLAEGEEAFLDILNNILNDQTPKSIYIENRLKDLNVPSPYTTGVFDSLIKQHPTAVWAMTIETNRGCPYSCTFCDWGGGLYNKTRKFNLEKVQEELDWASKNPVSYLFVADANFGMFRDRDIQVAKMLKDTAEKGQLESVSVQYAKNSTEIVFEIAKILGKLSRGVTVSVQSMNDSTLLEIKRKNLSINNIKVLMELSKKHNVTTYTEVILGLPMETLETWKDGLCDILDLGQHDAIDMWFCHLLENSELNQLNSRLRYGIETTKVKDYLSFVNVNDYDLIKEEIEIITKTNTLTSNDLVECYMYGWMIIAFHINGYTQICSKYARNKLGISYRKFYDQFYSMIIDSKEFSDHYRDMRMTIEYYIKHGSLPDDTKLKVSGNGHGLYTSSYEFIYEHRQFVFDLAYMCAKTFDPDAPTDLLFLQQNMVYDQQMSLPMDLDLSFDPTTFESNYTSCQIDNLNNIKKFDYNSRRKGLMKNIIK